MEGEHMPEETKGKLVVVTVPTESASTMRGARDEVRRVVEETISVETLQRGFKNFMDTVSQILQTGYNKVGDFSLDEISFSAEIGAEGEFKLLGTGVGVSGNAGITFKLHRQSAEK
jgi:hypothetical protein